MNRRALLASSGSALTAATAGCLSGRSVDLSDVEIPPHSGECGTLAQPQSERFIDDDEDSSCHDGAMTSLAVANERDEEITVEVAIEPRTADGEATTDGESTEDEETNDDEVPEDDGSFAETYTLPPGERAVEYIVVEAAVSNVATITVDGEEPVTREWATESCYRRGISVTPEGIEAGIIPPMSGPGDVSHDFYAGDWKGGLSVSVAEGASHIVTVIVVDHCEETTERETRSLRKDGLLWVLPWASSHGDYMDWIENGGVYDIVIAVEGGETAVYEYYDDYNLLMADIDTDGRVSFNKWPIR